MKNVTSAAVAAAAAALACLCSSAQAQLDTSQAFKDVRPFAMVGISNLSGYGSSSLGLKLGAESTLATLRGTQGLSLGATGYYAYTGGKSNYLSNCSYKSSAHSFAAGPTLNLTLPSPSITFQARSVLSWTHYSTSWDCGVAHTDVAGSGSAFDLGYGVGVRMPVGKALTPYADYDSVGWHAGLFSVGAAISF